MKSSFIYELARLADRLHEVAHQAEFLRCKPEISAAELREAGDAMDAARAALISIQHGGKSESKP